MHKGIKSEVVLNKLYLLGFSHIAAKCGMIAAKKGLAKILSEHPKSVQELAGYLNFTLTGTKKFLRVLDAFELIELDGELVKASFLTPHLDYLLGTHLLHGYKVIDDLEFSLEKDTACWSDVYGKDFYQYVGTEQGESQTFSTWCKKTAELWLRVVTSIYDFSPYKKIVDLGGSSGELLLSILKKNTESTGVLFDLPIVIESAKVNLALDPVGRKIECISGDFFEKIPLGGNFYILSRTLLNWTDEKSINVINNCYNSMRVNDKLLILDFVLPEKSDPSYHQAVLSDINLYAVLNSTNRTKDEWLKLISKSQFKTCSYTQTSSEITSKNELIMPICLLEMLKST